MTVGPKHKISQLEEEVEMQSQLLETAQSDMNDKIEELESVELQLVEEKRLRNNAENDCAEARAALPKAEAGVGARGKVIQHLKVLLQKTIDERAYCRNLSEAADITLAVASTTAKNVEPSIAEMTGVDDATQKRGSQRVLPRRQRDGD